jgi:hypothetical protein
MIVKNMMFLSSYQINFELILRKKNKKGKMKITFPIDLDEDFNCYNLAERFRIILLTFMS